MQDLLGVCIYVTLVLVDLFTPEIARQIDFSFEQIFINSLKGIIKPEDIHFVGGEGNFISALMKKSDAGIHCLISEIPQ